MLGRTGVSDTQRFMGFQYVYVPVVSIHSAIYLHELLFKLDISLFRYQGAIFQVSLGD
jgi:hypothetical protein